MLRLLLLLNKQLKPAKLL